MSEVTLKWLDGWNFEASDSDDFSITLGSGEARRGIKPTELLLMALGGCTGIDVVSILEKKQQQVTGVEIRVSGERRDEHPKSFTSYHVHYIVKGHDLADKAVADSIRLSEERYCSVSASLRPGAPVTTSYEIIEE